jgi:ABC-type multidrug transport system ATPase subunit
MDVAVRFKSAVCLLGRFPALTGFDLDVAAGEVVVVQGANGAGKTTLLRACAGLVPVVAGEAFACGVDLRADRRRVRALVGLVGSGGTLYDDLTVAENVRFAARAARRSPDRPGVDEMLTALGVPARLRSVGVGRLSAGQRRRVELAAQAIKEPRLWLLDEPHAGLDARGRDLLDALVSDAAARGAGVLLVSHEPDVVALAGRVVTIAGGTVVAKEPVGVA